MTGRLFSRRHAIALTASAAAGLSMPALAKGDGVAQAIDQLAKDVIRNGDAPGLQVMVRKGDRQILSGNYGLADMEFGAPVRAGTAFRIASVTKQFTAAALLRLQEEGKLALEDTLAKYYPRFPRADEVTLSRMANHTSGIHNYVEQPDMLADVMIRRDADASAAYFAAMPVVYDFAPGTSWSYSNSAYIMLGGVIEKASGQPLADVLRTRFFDPLGMKHTALDDERVIVPGRASGYDHADGGGFANAGYLSVIATGGAGGLRSTATDLATWIRGLFAGKVLSEASRTAMLTPARLADGAYPVTAPMEVGSARQGYGYGIRTHENDGRWKVRHAGDIHGFRSEVVHFPDEALTIAVLCNCSTTRPGVLGFAKKVEALLA